MKTLIDVIKAWEICDETVTANCPNCPYDIDCENVPGENLRADTLHYLKEYSDYIGVLRVKEIQLDQDIDSYQKAIQQCEETLKDYFALKQIALRQHCTEEQYNPPLTWDELKAMEGKPVWMEVDYHNPEETYKYWTIVKYFDSHEGSDMVFTGTGFYHKDLLGIDWRAYRKEKNETN